MARPKSIEARDTRRELLDAALELFAENGFHGTGLRDIARAVGVREGTVYHHFASKEALFEALITEPPDDAAGYVVGLVGGQTPDDLLPMFEELLVGMMERLARLRERKKFRLLMNDGMRLALDGKISFMDQAGGAARAEMTRFMKRLVAEGRLDGDPEMLTVAFIAPVLMWRQMVALGSPHRFAHDFRHFARAHATHFLRGAEPRTAPSAAASKKKPNGRSTGRRPRA